MRKKTIAVITGIIVAVMVVAGSLDFVINSKSVSPFKNSWTMSPNDTIESEYSTDKSVYVAAMTSYQSVRPNINFEYSIYKLNLSNGHPDWQSQEI